MEITADSKVILFASDFLANGIFIGRLGVFSESGEKMDEIILCTYSPETLIDLGQDLVEAGEKLQQLHAEFPTLAEIEANLAPLSPTETQQGAYDGHTSDKAA
jgi:hypothetical protein